MNYATMDLAELKKMITAMESLDELAGVAGNIADKIGDGSTVKDYEDIVIAAALNMIEDTDIAVGFSETFDTGTGHHRFLMAYVARNGVSSEEDALLLLNSIECAEFCGLELEHSIISNANEAGIDIDKLGLEEPQGLPEALKQIIEMINSATRTNGSECSHCPNCQVKSIAEEPGNEHLLEEWIGFHSFLSEKYPQGMVSIEAVIEATREFGLDERLTNILLADMLDPIVGIIVTRTMPRNFMDDDPEWNGIVH